MISNLSNTINSYKEKTNNNEEIKAILLFKCGFDGSSNHTIYNINVKEQMGEGNIIAVFICPLKLYMINDGTVQYYGITIHLIHQSFVDLLDFGLKMKQKRI